MNWLDMTKLHCVHIRQWNGMQCSSDRVLAHLFGSYGIALVLELLIAAGLELVISSLVD
jgi:hypothetical protein